MLGEMIVVPVSLEGRHVRLEPLAKAHLTELAQVGLEEELWRWIPTPVRTQEEMAAHSDEFGSEIPSPQARFRNAGLHARGIENRFAERALASGDPAHRGAGRRHLPEPHDYIQRAHPAYGLFQHHRFGVAGGESAPGIHLELP